MSAEINDLVRAMNYYRVGDSVRAEQSMKEKSGIKGDLAYSMWVIKGKPQGISDYGEQYWNGKAINGFTVEPQEKALAIHHYLMSGMSALSLPKEVVESYPVHAARASIRQAINTVDGKIIEVARTRKLTDHDQIVYREEKTTSMGIDETSTEERITTYVRWRDASPDTEVESYLLREHRAVVSTLDKPFHSTAPGETWRALPGVDYRLYGFEKHAVSTTGRYVWLHPSDKASIELANRYLIAERERNVPFVAKAAEYGARAIKDLVTSLTRPRQPNPLTLLSTAPESIGDSARYALGDTIRGPLNAIAGVLEGLATCVKGEDKSVRPAQIYRIV